MPGTGYVHSKAAPKLPPQRKVLTEEEKAQFIEDVRAADKLREAAAAATEATARSESQADYHNMLFSRGVPLSDHEPPTWTKENNWISGTQGGGGKGKGKGKDKPTAPPSTAAIQLSPLPALRPKMAPAKSKKQFDEINKELHDRGFWPIGVQLRAILQADDFRARMSKKINPDVKVVADMALGAAKRQQLEWPHETPKTPSQPAVKPAATAKVQATPQPTQPAQAQKTDTNKQKMLKASGVAVNPAATIQKAEDTEQQ